MMTPDRRQLILVSVPMKHVGHAHEVAGCALFRTSDLSNCVTGSEFDRNSGSHIH